MRFSSWGSRGIASACVAFVCAAGAGDALADSAEERADITIYRGQGVDANLLDVLPKLAKGTLDYDPTFFTGAAWHVPLATPGWMQSFFSWLGAPGTKTGVEMIAVKHEGLQENWEADVAYVFRFAPFRFWGISVRGGVGFGLSEAFGTPTYEDGPRGNRERRYKFQNYDAYELDWRLDSAPRWALVTRIHHRSGIFGVIAPRYVGSNFLAVGVRYAY